MTEPVQPPEAELIERLREHVSPRLSIAKAAKAAGISEGRWRQIAKGYQQATPTTRLPVRAPADTLARMALVVGATAEQLEAAGRADAAAELKHTPPAGQEILLSELPIDILLGEVRRRVVASEARLARVRGDDSRGTAVAVFRSDAQRIWEGDEP